MLGPYEYIHGVPLTLSNEMANRSLDDCIMHALLLVAFRVDFLRVTRYRRVYLH